VIAIIPVWSARTTGDWRLTPLLLYTRMYMPYDVPGFGLVTTPPARAVTPELLNLNHAYSSLHVDHFPSRLPAILRERAFFLWVSAYGATSGIMGVFAFLGLRTLTRETAFAVGSGVFLLVVYLVFATPPTWTLYYYESIPAYAFLSASGLAWVASLIGRPLGHAAAPTFSWRSPRWTHALALGAVMLVLPGFVSFKILQAGHHTDRVQLERFYRLLATIHDDRAVMFVRHSPMHDVHVQFVQNTAHPSTERVWVVYDRGDGENARLLVDAPGRKAYLFDETSGRTYIYNPRAASDGGVR
jgi:hypothetical protein